MTRTALAMVAVLAMLVAARAKPLECVLWPKTCQVPVVVPANPEPPLSQPAPIQPAPPVVVVAPPVPVIHAAPPPRHRAHKAAPKPKPVAKPHPRVKSKFAKPKRRTVDAGPDLPWPCWQVRLNALGKSEAALRAEGRARGIKLTSKQEGQARDCLASK